MNKRKLCMYFFTAFLTVGSVSGCSTGSNPTQNTSQDPAQSSGQNSVQNSNDIATLRIMGVNRTASLSNERVSLQDWVNGDSRLWEKVENDLLERGISLDLNLIAEDQYGTVAQTQLAAGLDCDIMNITPLDTRTRLRLVEQNRIISINEIWDMYSNGTAKEFFTSGPGAFSIGLTALENGNVYWLTDVQTSTFGDKIVGSTLGFHIRKDWLDKLNLPVPQTTAELFTTLQAFQEQDVNNSGEKDEVIFIEMNSFNTGIAQWFGFGPSITYVDDMDGGKIKSPWYHENIKEYIKFVNSLVSAGLVDTSNQLSVKKPENKIAGFNQWAMSTWEEPQVNVPVGEAAPYYLPFLARALDTQEPWALLQRGNQISHRGYAVTSECKNPEAVAILLDYLTTPEFFDLTEYGIEGYTYTIDSNGNRERIKEGSSEIQLMASGVAALWTNDSIFPRYTIGKAMEDEMNEMVQAGREAGYPEEGYQAKWDFSNMLYSYAYTTAHDPEADLAIATVEEMERISEISTDLHTYSGELLTKLILGQQSLDDWDVYISDLKRLGLDELIQINQTRYDRAH